MNGSSTPLASKSIIIAIALIILAAIGYYAISEYESSPSEIASSIATSSAQGSLAMLHIAGTWRSTDDAKFVRTFGDDGSVVDTYEGDAGATEHGTYRVVDPATEKDFPAPPENFVKVKVIRVDWEHTGTMYYGIHEVTDTSLSMTNISGTGNVLSFTRVQ